MSDLVRFGVAMERTLLEEFDRRIAARGYENRSEALRDLVRADLTKAAWEGGAHVVATLTLVYSNGARDRVLRLADLEPPDTARVVSSLRVNLDQDRVLEAMVVRGPSSELTALAGRLGGAKGVLSCELALAAVTAPDPDAPRRPAPRPERRAEERR
jgi:CopG family transcriptional regulator, nickel-responsive regulator